MNIYELVTPSDPITFKTDNDKIAFACAVFLGKGMAGCERIEENGNRVDIPSLLAFSSDVTKRVQEYLGVSLTEFLDQHHKEMGECFLTFAYASVSERKTYDDAIEAITEPEKLQAFKAKHEDRNRSSMSEWVLSAWKFGKKMIEEQD